MADSVISKNDCEHIIKSYVRSTNYRILAYEIQPWTSSEKGLMGENFLLKIKVELPQITIQPSFFVKKVLQLYPLSSQFATDMATFERELFTYKTLLPKFESCIQSFKADFVPNCYFGKKNLIVLENLCEQNYVIQPNWKMEELKLALTTLANYHSGTLAYEEIKSQVLGRPYRVDEDYQSFLEDPTFNRKSQVSEKFCYARSSSLQSLADVVPLKSVSPEFFKETLGKLVDTVFGRFDKKHSYRRVFNHGDLWSQNVLFKYDECGIPQECKFVDFALQHYSPPACDVLFLIYFFTDEDTRRKSLSTLLKHYYNSLGVALLNSNVHVKEILPFWDFEESINHFLPEYKLRVAFTKCLVYGMNTFLTKVGKVATVFENHFFEDGAPFTLELFHTDLEYKKTMTDCILELEELLVQKGLSREDCYKIIEKKIGSNNYELISYNLNSLGKVSGFLGSHYKLKILIKIGGVEKQLNLFVKYPPKGNTQLGMANDTLAFYKEAITFREILPLMENHGNELIKEFTIPCFLATLNTVVFEDFDIHDYNCCSSRTPLGYSDLVIILKQLAKFHASTFLLEEEVSRKEGRQFRLIQKFNKALQEPFFLPKETNSASIITAAGLEAIPYLIERFPNYKLKISRSTFISFAKSMIELAYERVKPSETFRNCICHGDLWATNFMIKRENGHPVDCRIIDFQLLRYCPPAHDVLGVLYLTTNREIREKFRDALITIYYNELTRILDENNISTGALYSFDRFTDSCEYMEPQVIIQSIIYYQVVLSDPEYMKEYIKDENNMRKLFMDDRKGYLKHVYERDPIHKQRLEESIEDLQNLCIKQERALGINSISEGFEKCEIEINGCKEGNKKII